MKTFLFLALLLIQNAFAQNVNDISGTFKEKHAHEAKLQNDSHLPSNENFSSDESFKRGPASDKSKPTHHITEITGTFDK